jgi:AraC-like DNA-binding protein
MIRQLHLRLESGEASLLEQEFALLRMLVCLILRHADTPPVLRDAGRERGAVKRAKDYIAAYCNENISVEQIAGTAYLSPFHFIRVFHKETGLTPHAYLTQVRIRQARTLLSQGETVASVAYQTGFADQSHLTRHFKRIVGIPPGQYSNFVQDR